VPAECAQRLPDSTSKRTHAYFNGKYDNNVADAYRMRLRALRERGMVDPPGEDEDEDEDEDWELPEYEEDEEEAGGEEGEEEEAGGEVGTVEGDGRRGAALRCRVLSYEMEEGTLTSPVYVYFKVRVVV
jgi:hypothetical protein